MKMEIKQHISLRPYNSFGIDATAKYFAAFDSIDKLQALLQDKMYKQAGRNLILGGGSNLLFTKDFDGIVLKNELKGISLVKEDTAYYYVKAGAGENWHQFVMYCVAHNYAGIENLSLIPGNAGASPMQNIGAYGVEIKDCFYSLEALHKKEHTRVTFTNADCQFGYRDSVFKQQYKDTFIIVSVTFRLHKTPVFHTHYGAIEKELEAMGVKELSIQEISRAVIRIRQSKLPDPAVLGNAGSFFKNPVISAEQHASLKAEFPQMISFPFGEKYKVAAAWLIEQCGWKGFRRGDTGCHKNQALVLVNYGKATGSEIFELSREIIESVNATFHIQLEREVNIY